MAGFTVEPTTLTQPTLTLRPWQDFARLGEEELGRQDIVEVHLACAMGLPGSEKIDVGLCRFKLDYWTRRVEAHTNKMLPQFRRKRYEYNNSVAYFRILCLITVLQRDLGVHYNPDKIPEDAVFDLEDTFLHGIIRNGAGTCATLPVLYAAVGRRLGYPLKLVTVYGGPKGNHCFARWDEPGGERFNVEASGQGLSCHPDDYYRTGRYAGQSLAHEKAGQFFQSKTPRMELASFLAERAIVWEENQQLRPCVEAYAWATALVPENSFYSNTLKRRMNDWLAQLRTKEPSGFPSVYVKELEPIYPPSLPLDLRVGILGMVATDNLLNDARHDTWWWSRMRQGEQRENSPIRADAEFRRDGCDIGLRFASRN